MTALPGTVLLALAASRGWGLAPTFASLGLLGAGLGLAASTSAIGPQMVAPWHHRGSVTSAMYATRALGGSLAIAMLSLARGSFAHQFGIIAAMTGTAAVVLGALAPGVLSQRRIDV